MAEPLVLGRHEIAEAMTPKDYMAAIENGLRQLVAGQATVADVVHIESHPGVFHIKSAAFSGDAPAVAIKVNANFPRNPSEHGLPTIQGTILLCDGKTGSLLAILDSGEVTAQRTAATSALAAQRLAMASASVAAIIGCGVQGRAHLTALCELFALEQVYAHDMKADVARAFAEQMSAYTGVRVAPVTSVREATRQSQIVVTSTTSRRGFLSPDDVAPGTFIAAVGADNPDKQELLPELVVASALVVDLIEQCATIGELRHALAAGVVTRAHVRAELAQVVTGMHPGRLSDDEIVVFDSTGTAIQDVAAAVTIYNRACESGVGRRIALG